MKLKLTLLTLLLLIMPIGAQAFKYEGLVYNILDEEAATVEVGENSGVSEEVVIPSVVTYKGKSYNVIKIGYHAFYNDRNLKSIVFPDGLTSIGYQSFEGCKRLRNITLPPTLTSIEDNAFYICMNLESINFPEGLTSIGGLAFHSCISLKNIVIPSKVTYIGAGAFNQCEGLTSVTLPEGLTSIESNVFFRCKGLTSIEVPATVTSIGEGAFYECSNLKSVVLPEGLTSIGITAFLGCYSLVDIVIPASVKEIGSGAFGAGPRFSMRKITLESETPQMYWVPTLPAYASFLAPVQGRTALLVKPELFDDLYTTDTEHSEYYYPQPFVLDGLMYESTLDDDHYDVRITDVDGAHEKVSILPTIEAYGTQFNVTECAASFTLRENQYVKELYVDLPMSHIPAYFCADASALEKLTLTENVVSIGEHAFDGTALESVRCEASVPPVCEGYPFGEVGNGTEKIKLIVNSDDVDAYEADEYWGALFSVEADTESAVTEIGVVDSESEIYNLQGVRVERPLVPGVYIVNGRKVVVR